MSQSCIEIHPVKRAIARPDNLIAALEGSKANFCAAGPLSPIVETNYRLSERCVGFCKGPGAWAQKHD
ncbi:MAG: hypothetical protein EBZ03_03450 [Betaproteobacteria bacterium]|nr:hypothetical protein [Betaproteobacteria bacterium]NBO44256.1 hypothetical protein [Betaproteobacteria bacterium]NBP09550.1 hypothetical protein [Betaproteobacteria bacterium]NBP60877.1 hypothetical protein [Betaproteobacteria bacterium]NBQ08143.1 hypothetical protein [Betaproteobacteria bacterium]